MAIADDPHLVDRQSGGEDRRLVEQAPVATIMSGIFGVCRFDGVPVASEQLDAMRRAMEHWGPDGVRCWREGAAGFGQCLIADTPEASHEALPLYAEQGQFAFTAEARLDNRDELFEALGVGYPERTGMADGELMRRAYLRWGSECPSRLLGDWSLAAWHPQERRVFLARDHHGTTSLHYVSEHRRFAFGSDRHALLALPGVSRRLNDLFLAQLLVSWTAYYGTATAYRDIHRLPPAHAMLITPGGTKTWRYWRLEDAPDIRMGTMREYADGMREHLRQAVKVRLRSAMPVAVTLSAGLDSGSVAAMAAHELAAAGQRLTALTAVPVHTIAMPNAVANEFALASDTARMAGNIDHVAVGSTRHGQVEGLERGLRIHGEPVLAAGHIPWLVPVVEAARGHVLLTGQGGNAGVSWQGLPHMADVAAALRSGRIAGAVRAWARLGLVGRGRDMWHRMLAERQAGGQAWRADSPIHPRFAERVGLRDLMKAEGYDPTGTRQPRDGREARLRLLNPGRDLVGALWAQLGAFAQTSIRDPTVDVKLLAFVVGLPDRCWRGPQARWLIREAMRGSLPDSVRLARHQGRQASDIVPRLTAERSGVEHLLSEIEASDEARQYIDVKYLRQVVQELPLLEPETGRRQALAVVMRGLATGLFVARATGR